MRAAGTIKRYLENPTGAWVAGRCFLVWNWSPALSGIAVWGRPTETDVESLFIVADAYQRVAPACDVVTDVSRVDALEATAFGAFALALRRRASHYQGTHRRVALVRPDGLVGGIAEGFLTFTEHPNDGRVFPEAAQAFAWLDRPGAAQACTEVERLVDTARGLSPELRRLRDYLRANLRGARLAAAADALAMSERTLHRTLRDAQTCFRDELTAARVEAARQLLAETDLKIQEIARRVGYASHAHLTSLFTRSTGQSPAAYREQTQRGN